MSPFADLPELPGLGRCECGAPKVASAWGVACYTSGSRSGACCVVVRRGGRPPFQTGHPVYTRECRLMVTEARLAYWREVTR